MRRRASGVEVLVMLEEKYVWCCNCNEIHHITPFDKASLFAFREGEVREVAMDDWRAFMRQHWGHKLERLRGSGKRYTPGKTWDPMETRYVEVTNGRELFVLKAFRKSIEEPLRFEIVRGRLGAGEVILSVCEDEIRKEMKHHFAWAPSERPSDEKVELFVRLLSEVVDELDPADIRVCGYDHNESSVAYGALEPHAVETLLKRLKSHFLSDELKALRRFVETYGEGLVRIEQRYRIEGIAE